MMMQNLESKLTKIFNFEGITEVLCKDMLIWDHLNMGSENGNSSTFIEFI